jgi:hypothetical protein
MKLLSDDWYQKFHELGPSYSQMNHIEHGKEEEEDEERCVMKFVVMERCFDGKMEMCLVSVMTISTMEKWEIGH